MEKKKISKNIKTNTKKKTTNKKLVLSKAKKKKKGFTLIELLAVIIILGILMIIAIPSVTNYINDSRKSAYVDTAKNIVSGARNKVNEGNLSMYDTNTTYYLPYDMIESENATKSPYGDFEEAYVVVTYDGKGYNYYWTSIDDSKIGILLTYSDLLDTDDILTDMTGISTDIGVGERTRIVIFDKDGKIASDHLLENEENSIPDKGKLSSTGTNCDYKLVTTVGSFSDSSNLKEICVKLVNYEVTIETSSGGYGSWAQGRNTIARIAFSKEDFNDNSYVRIYNNSNKEQLLLEVTKDTYPKYIYPIYDGENSVGYQYVKTLSDGYQSTYIEYSPDLQALNEEFFYKRAEIYYGTTRQRTYSGLWFYREKDIERINTLRNIVYNSTLAELCPDGYTSDGNFYFAGFEECTDSSCEPNTYNAYYVDYCMGDPN